MAGVVVVAMAAVVVIRWRWRVVLVDGRVPSRRVVVLGGLC